MNHQHRPHTSALIPEHPVRCLRHRVWMAICDDCRAAHSAVVTDAEPRSTAAR